MTTTPPDAEPELSAEALARLDAAIATIQDVLGPFIRLTAEEAQEQRCELGILTETFCRQTLLVLQENRALLAPDFDPEEIRWALGSFDALRLRLLRLRELLDGGEGTASVLADDVLAETLRGYALLMLNGNEKIAERLEGLRTTCFGPPRHTRPSDEPPG